MAIRDDPAASTPSWEAAAARYLDEGEVPDGLTCALSRDLYVDPVQVSNGQCYEGSYWRRYVAGAAAATVRDPLTRVPVAVAAVPAGALQRRGAAFREAVAVAAAARGQPPPAWPGPAWGSPPRRPPSPALPPPVSPGFPRLTAAGPSPAAPSPSAAPLPWGGIAQQLVADDAVYGLAGRQDPFATSLGARLGSAAAWPRRRPLAAAGGGSLALLGSVGGRPGPRPGAVRMP